MTAPTRPPTTRIQGPHAALSRAVPWNELLEGNGTDAMNKVFFGDCRDTMRDLIAQGVKVQMCVTSPPYFGLRDYGHAGQLGLEATPAEFVAAMVEVFGLVRELLADDGVLWLNLGDSYAGAGYSNHANTGGAQRADGGKQRHLSGTGLKPKDLIGIPWRVAFALQAAGWYLRQDIIWHKPNPMPESVTDRCTKAHEYMFLLSKSERLEFSRLVDLFNLAADPEDLTVTIDIDEAEIVVASDRYRIHETFTPAPLELAMYLLFARSHLAGTEIRRPAKGSADGHLLREYLQELLPLLGLPVMAEDDATLDGLERIEDHQDQSFDNEVRVAGKTLQALKGDQSNMDNFRGVGITQSWFDNRRTELRKAFSERLPEPLANWLLPSADTKGGDYGLPLEKRQLVIR